MNSQTQENTVNFEELGLSFVIPSGWTSEVQGDYMFLNHNAISGLMVVFESRSQSIEKLLILANNGIEEEGVKLNSLNDFRATSEKTIEGHYQGVFMGSVVKVFAIAKINGLGSGISILALSKPEDFNALLKVEANKLSASVKFKKVKLSKKTKLWSDRIIGKRLRYYDTQTTTNFEGGISYSSSDRETLDLFNDGSFYHYVNRQSTVNSETTKHENNTSGNFRIVTLEESTYLQLFSDEGTLEFELTVNNKNHTLLNGTRYLLDSIED